MNKHSIINILVFVSFAFILITQNSCDPLYQGGEESKLDYHTDLVAKGWKLIRKWDFYNDLENWNHSLVTPKNSGGYVKVEDGVFEFGYSKGKTAVYYKNKIRAIPFTTYMIIARVKTDNPFGSSVGFFSPGKNELRGGTRIRRSGWHIVKAILSFDPKRGEKKPPKRMYPAVQNLTRHDYTYIDWLEFWTFSKDKAK